MSFTNLGIASNLPLNTLVQAFLDAERVPAQTRLEKKEESLKLELSGVGSFKSALSSFQDTVKKLTADNAFAKQAVTVNNDNIAVATNGFASSGEFDVNVQQLATGSRLKSSSFAAATDTVGSGTLTFTAGSKSFNLDIGAGDDLSAIRDKINADADNFGVTANVLKTDAGTFLILNSAETGSANNLTVTSSDASLAAISTNNTVEQSAQDARITIDGNVITNSSNEFKNFIEDVTITAKKVTTDENSKLTIAQDVESGKKLIDDFINDFNALTDQLTGLGAPVQGRLAFDPNVRQVKQQITDALLSSVVGEGAIENLQDLGIEINKSGKLQISTFSSDNIASGQTRLQDAIENNADSVGKFFASANGVGTQISTIVDTYVKSDGVLTLREKSLNEQISDVDDEFSALQERLTSLEKTLIKQFTALDSAVAGFNSTQSFVKSALGNISNTSNNNN